MFGGWFTYPQVGASGKANRKTLRYCVFLTMTQALVCATDIVLKAARWTSFRNRSWQEDTTHKYLQKYFKGISDHWCAKRILPPQIVSATKDKVSFCVQVQEPTSPKAAVTTGTLQAVLCQYLSNAFSRYRSLIFRLQPAQPFGSV